jgi:hypothetical protein
MSQELGVGLPPQVDRRAFELLDMHEVDHESMEAELAAAGDKLVCAFFWGVDCYNCDIAKKALIAGVESLRQLDLHWLHANVYGYPALTRRYGLYGIPVFMFFHRGKKLGRATGWHGIGQFNAAVANARLKAAGKPLAG